MLGHMPICWPNFLYFCGGQQLESSCDYVSISYTVCGKILEWEKLGNLVNGTPFADFLLSSLLIL